MSPGWTDKVAVYWKKKHLYIYLQTYQHVLQTGKHLYWGHNSGLFNQDKKIFL